MGVLAPSWTSKRVSLGRRCLVGRSPSAGLCIAHCPRVSHEHATIFWSRGYWEIRDLGSTNGTWVDGERVPVPGMRLERNVCIAFGDSSAECVLVDDHPPQASARCRATGQRICAEDELLMLPSPARPLALVSEEEQGWMLTMAGCSVAVSDQALVAVDGTDWTLELPPTGLAVTTRTEVDPERGLGDFELELRHSLDEESVEARLASALAQHSLGVRAHHHLLLVLARSRLRDARTPLPPSEQGWLHIEDVCRALGSSPEPINVSIWRARRQLQHLGIVDAEELVQRRRGTGQLRLGPIRPRVVGPTDLKASG